MIKRLTMFLVVKRSFTLLGGYHFPVAHTEKGWSSGHYCCQVGDERTDREPQIQGNWKEQVYGKQHTIKACAGWLGTGK